MDESRARALKSLFETQRVAALGSWYSHEAVACTTGGVLSATFTPAEGGTYYLVAPLHDSVEGSCGNDSSGTQRPPAAASCGGWVDPTVCP